MIRSGWILPDLHEVPCKSCSTLNGHIEVVKRYLEALKFKDFKLYENIMKCFNAETSKSPYIGLDDFAVMKLGWIKVNNTPSNMIFYTDNCDLDLTIRRYLNQGYHPVEFSNCRIKISVPYLSQELI